MFLGTGGSLSLRGFPLDVVRDVCEAQRAFAAFADSAGARADRLAQADRIDGKAQG